MSNIGVNTVAGPSRGPSYADYEPSSMTGTGFPNALLGPDGKPIGAEKRVKSKSKIDPALGPAFGDWAGRDTVWNQMPGGGILGFNLDLLTLADFRAMRYNPQINVSLTLLAFMMHQSDWKIKCEDKKIQTEIDDQLRPLWTRLVRGLSQALWAGYSPNVLQFDNDVDNRRIVLSKVKDLIPEDCEVWWRYTDMDGNFVDPGGSWSPQTRTYGGIRQYGSRTIPSENSLWFPLLMENGNYYGRKLLKAAFAPWYFSTLIHLFSNRYYERFGEPTPIGRYPQDDEFPRGDGTFMSGKEAMENILMSLRNRSVVVLPNTAQPYTLLSNSGGSGATHRALYDYDISFLESQMRGADFERYLSRLDEEMSLSLITPMLLVRSGDVGSHNLGVQHAQTWLWCLNALLGDMKEYIDRYVVDPIKCINFGDKAAKATWEPNKLGKENVQVLQAMVTALLTKGAIGVDLDELGQALGLSLHEVAIPGTPPGQPGSGDSGIAATPPEPKVPPAGQPGGLPRSPRTGEQAGSGKPRGVGEPRATGRQISNRIRQQVEKAWREQRFGPELALSPGYHRRMIESFRAEGWAADHAESITSEIYDKVDRWSKEVVALGMSEFDSPNDFMSLFDRNLDNLLDDIRRD